MAFCRSSRLVAELKCFLCLAIERAARKKKKSPTSAIFFRHSEEWIVNGEPPYELKEADPARPEA